MAETFTWGRLLAIGAKEKEAYRRVELDCAEVVIGRKEGVTERIVDNTVSSTHCKITLVRREDEYSTAQGQLSGEGDGDDDDDEEEEGYATLAVEAWLEDCSANVSCALPCGLPPRASRRGLRVAGRAGAAPSPTLR